MLYPLMLTPSVIPQQRAHLFIQAGMGTAPELCPESTQGYFVLAGTFWQLVKASSLSGGKTKNETGFTA